jgi:hypothetical protein
MEGSATMTNTLKHIEALQAASLELESQLRANGRSRDCITRDCDHVSDAVRRGMKSGFAMLFDESGEPEIIPLGANAGKVEVAKGKEPGHFKVSYGEAWHNPGREEKRRDETDRIATEASEAPYRQTSGKNWEQAQANSHTRERETKGRFEPTSHAKDAARLNAELKAKQAKNAADARAFAAEQFSRNERIAAAMKERSAQIHR